MGGTIARHVAEGDEVIMLVLTNSAYYNYDGTLIRSIDTARSEGERAAKILGVKELISGNFETKTLVYGFQLIETINKVIDDYKIDTVYTHWDKDVHQDHSAVGRSTLNAARHVKNIFMYRSNWYHTTSQFMGNYFVDISTYIEKKIESVKAHENECAKFGQGWIDFFVNENFNSGQRVGTRYAECFEIVKVYR